MYDSLKEKGNSKHAGWGPGTSIDGAGTMKIYKRGKEYIRFLTP